MKFIRLSCIALLLLSALFTENIKAQELRTGDKCPVYPITNVINYTSPVLRLSDFKGKVVILDFWNTYCSACIQAFPKLDSLQKLFEEDIQIILVNSENSEKTEIFFKKHPNITRPGLPMIIGDTKLRESFPSEGKPYIVWIDKQGLVKNFSNGTNVSKQNIQYFINETKLLFRDPTLERFGSAIQEDNFECISFISHCYETLNIGNCEIQEINKGKSVTIKSNCSSVTALFIKAFDEFGKYNFETKYGLKLKVADSFKYLYPENLELMDYWLNENAYNYQLVLPKIKIEQAYKIMQQDLIRYFDMNAFLKKTLVDGIVLFKDSIIAPLEKEIIKKNEKIFEYAKSNPDSVYIFTNEPFDIFSGWLKTRLSYFFPLSDSTNYHGNISLILRKSSLSPFNINQFLQDIAMVGLSCLKKDIEVEVLHIEERSIVKGQ